MSGMRSPEATKLRYVSHYPVWRTMRPLPPMPLLHAAITRWKSLVCIALLCALATCSKDPVDPLAEVAGRLGVRLSVASSLQACPEAVPAGGTIPARHCPALNRRAWKRIAELAGEGDESNPAVLHTTALVDLISEDSSGKALDQSISTLRRAAELARDPGPVLADLAAALLLRAERLQTPRDLLEAYENSESALESDPRNLAALYNRALALDRFGLVDVAIKDWQAYLSVDSTSDWATDARRRHTAALTLRAEHIPASDASPRTYRRYAAADPQGARELGINSLLTEWGEAISKRDTDRASDCLRRAAILGKALERARGGDASLADAVREIHALAGDTSSTHVLALAYQEYGEGLREYDPPTTFLAEARFFAAAERAEVAPVLSNWSRVWLGTAQLNLGGRSPERMLRELAERVDDRRYPALAAQVRQTLGQALFSTDRPEQAITELHLAGGAFRPCARTRERGSYADAHRSRSVRTRRS